MDDVLYNRQSTLKLNIPKSTLVVGCGGTGSWVALLLAMSGCPYLSLFDDDLLDLTNFNRLPLEEGLRGENKAIAVARLIARLRPDCLVATFGRANLYSLFSAEPGVVFDCTDNQDTQNFLYLWAKQENLPYIRCGYNGTHLTVTNKNSTWRTTKEATTGYTIVPSWVVGAALPACLAVAKALYCPTLNIFADISELKGEESGTEKRRRKSRN